MCHWAKKIKGYPCPPYKILILDECDSMTSWAQNALRRIMERYSRTTRFCLICNYITRIIPPLTSRCAKFRFRLLPQKAMIGRLIEICSKEDINVSDKTCDTLIKVSQGDMRKCINLLQSTKQLKNVGELITTSDILTVSIHIRSESIDRIIQSCEAYNFNTHKEFAQNVIADGFAISLIFEKFCQRVTQRKDITDLKKSQIVLTIAKADSALRKGAGEFLQLQKVLSIFSNILRNK